MSYSNMRYEFDAVRFVADMETAARQMGCRMSDVAREIGFDAGSYTRLKAGQCVPNGRILVALAAWAGLDLRSYCTDRRAGQVDPPMPRTMAEAKDTIRRLRAELQELRT